MFLKPKLYKSNDLSIIILGSLIPSRSKTFGPKSLTLINNEYLINYQHRVLKYLYPNAEQILVVGHQAKKVNKIKPDDVISIENEDIYNAGNAEEIRLGLSVASGSKVIILSDNIVLGYNFQKLHNYDSCILVTQSQSKTEVGTPQLGKLNKLSYNNIFTWTGLAQFANSELAILKEIVNNKAYSKFNFYEIINLICNDGYMISLLTPNESIIKIENEITNKRKLQSNV